MMQGAYILVRNDASRETALEDIRKREIGKKGFYVQIKEGALNRSTLQNAYLWGWVYVQIVDQLDSAGHVIPTKDGEHPYTKDILHEIFRTKFLQVGEIEATNGKTLPIYKSTTKLTKAEFSEYVDNVQKFAYQFWRVTVPVPNRGQWHDYYQQLGMGK